MLLVDPKMRKEKQIKKHNMKRHPLSSAGVDDVSMLKSLTKSSINRDIVSKIIKESAGRELQGHEKLQIQSALRDIESAENQARVQQCNAKCISEVMEVGRMAAMATSATLVLVEQSKLSEKKLERSEKVAKRVGKIESLNEKLDLAGGIGTRMYEAVGELTDIFDPSAYSEEKSNGILSTSQERILNEIQAKVQSDLYMNLPSVPLNSTLSLGEAEKSITEKLYL